MNITAYVISHIGLVRQNQEDNFMLDGTIITTSMQQKIKLQENCFVTEIQKINGNSAIFAVSDGMGGHNAGEVASYTVVRKLAEFRLMILSALDYIVAFQNCVDEINREILQLGKGHKEMAGMGATLAALLVKNGQVAAMNLGDSRIYRYDGEKFAQITSDHTEGQRLLNLKLMTSEELSNFPSRKSLNRYLGIPLQEGQLKADVYEVKVQREKEWFLICSDGLTDAVENTMIERTLQQHFYDENLHTTVEELVQLGLCGTDGNNGSGDNVTVILVQIKGKQEVLK